MQLFLDSVDLKEIEMATKLGFVAGLTTTPTFMHNAGVKELDKTLLKLSKAVPELHVEALGDTADNIYKEAQRLAKLGLDKKKTVFKIPISLEGVAACKKLTDKGFKVNIHLVYTLQQAYMAMTAGASYVCPLVGRLQDEGHDALALVEQIVEAVQYYGYDCKVMFSSVRHPEHVRNAINLGVDVCTVPWKVMIRLTENNFTSLGTRQFLEHNHLMTTTVRQAIRKQNPVVSMDDTVLDALVKMTESKLGSVTVLDKEKKIAGAFTDGDLRRYLEKNGKEVLSKKMSTFKFKKPITIAADALLFEAANLIKKHRVDNIIVVEGAIPVGMIDIQDIIL